MKSFYFILFLLHFYLSFSQSNTEIFLFDIENNTSNFQLKNGKNISNNKGYDSQPSFINDKRILFASTQNGQTDIAQYYSNNNSKLYIKTTIGSEYTPLKIPSKNAVSAVRLDKDGKQRLYKYNLSNGKSKILIKDLVVAYYTWYNKNIIVSAVIEGNDLNLYVTNLKENWNTKYATNVGRSFHKIPNSNLVSFISKENNNQWQIKSLNPLTGNTKVIANTMQGIEDICWLNNTLLSGKNNILYQLKKDNTWAQIADLKPFGISKITRIATNNSNTKLLVVGDVTTFESASKKNTSHTRSKPKTLKPKLENIAWIAGTWHGEAFGGKTEEIWSKPSGGSMMATFKLIKNGKIAFYEIEIIREVENTLMLQLKHFGKDLKGWETKDETVDFPLLKITEHKAIFKGMTFEKISNNEMNVYVDIKENGDTKTVKFNYIKKY
ncbi:MAG: DUF6265 family protein [Winogradskyella sp.]